MGQCLAALIENKNSNEELIIDKPKINLEEQKQTNIQSNRKENKNFIIPNEKNYDKNILKNINSLTSETQERTNFQEQLILNNQINKVKNSVYTNFRKGNPLLNKNQNRQTLLESLQSKNSDILFESFSVSNLDRGNNNSLLIDYYQIGKNIFDILNEIRCDPLEKGKEYNFNFDNYNPGDVILWNEKVYLCCSSYLKEIEKGKKNEISANEKVNEKLNGNYNLIEFNVEGLGTPIAIIKKLFNENKQWWNKLICDNYTSGAVCCYPFRNGKNMKTLIYLVQKQ